MTETATLLNKHRREQLHLLRKEDKFSADPSSLYPGAPSAKLHEEYESLANQLISTVEALPDDSTAEGVFEAFLRTLEKFDRADTEDRERIGYVCERIMEVLRLETSKGLLNTWLYGFDPAEITNDA